MNTDADATDHSLLTLIEEYAELVGEECYQAAKGLWHAKLEVAVAEARRVMIEELERLDLMTDVDREWVKGG